MPRTLPPRPNLVYLKHQAKDLRSLVREGDDLALATMRQVRRFRDASASDMASAHVTLAEAQYALSLDYGFASWAALRSHVRSVLARGPDPALGKRAVDGDTVLEGLETAHWGSGTRRQNSVIAAMALISERLGDEADYDWLMGGSAAAFRVQMSDDRLCPSSPNAAVGFDCRARAAHAWGREVKWFRTDDEHADNRPAARVAAIESIERGIPVLYLREECSLVVGWSGAEPLIRPYAAQRDGYEIAAQWAWDVGVVQDKAIVGRDASKVGLEALRSATALFETNRFGRYACGRHAYRRWAELLLDEPSISRQAPQERFMALLGNAHTLDSLADARSAAVNYIASLADVVPPAAQSCLAEATAAYADLERRLWQERRVVAPYPWELASLSDWVPELRAKQAAFLGEIAEVDGRAVARLHQVVSVASGLG
jgi:hypothetical protein